MRIVQAESTEYPLLLDTESSETTIFERQDIVEVEREGQTYYRYTEHQYPLPEWLRARVPQSKQQIVEVNEKLKAIEKELKKSNKDFKLPDSVVK